MYPIWEVPYLSSALVIGLIASFHVLPSHLAVGALWVTVFIEKIGLEKNRPEYFDFIKRFTLLLLIFCLYLWLPIRDWHLVFGYCFFAKRHLSPNP
jgi:hypothetical protein